MSAFYITLPVTNSTGGGGGGGGSNASVGTNGAVAPTSSTEIAAINPSGVLQPLKTDVNASLLIKRPDFAASGSLTSLSSSIVIDSTNLAEGAVVVSGTWVGTVAAQGTADGTTWSALATQLTGGGNPWTSAGQTANGEYKITGIAGYSKVRFVFTVYTSGTANLVANFSSVTTVVSVRQTNPVNLNATVTQGPAGVAAWKVDGSGVTQPVTGSVSVTNFPATQPVSGTVAVSTLPSIPTGSNAIGSVSVSNFPASQNVSVTNFPATQPVSGTVAVSNLSSLGQMPAASSLAVALANEDVQDMYLTGQATQTAIINNILPAASGASATDLTGYRSFTVQVTSTGTGGTFIFESSNDNVNFQPVPVVNTALTSSILVYTTAITATVSQIIYAGSVTGRYLRLRIVTAITGGSIQAFSKFSQASYGPLSQIVGQATAAAFNVTIGAGANGIGTVKIGPNGNGGQIYNAYGTTPVTTSAYVQLLAATTGTVITFKVFDSSGQAMILATGASGSEVPFAYVPPGGDVINYTVAAGTRISIKALTGNATGNYIIINMLT